MSIPAGQRANFQTLLRAAGNEDLALMECKDAKTGEYVDAICVVLRESGETIALTPVAIMLREDLIERLTPPLEEA